MLFDPLDITSDWEESTLDNHYKKKDFSICQNNQDLDCSCYTNLFHNLRGHTKLYQVRLRVKLKN